MMSLYGRRSESVVGREILKTKIFVSKFYSSFYFFHLFKNIHKTQERLEKLRLYGDSHRFKHPLSRLSIAAR